MRITDLLKKQGIALVKSDIIEDLSNKIFQKGDE